MKKCIPLLVSILSMLSTASVSAAEDPQPREVSLEQLLGADFAQAKIVGLDERTIVVDNSGGEKIGIVAAYVSGGKPVTIASWPKKDLRSGRTRWSVDGRQIIFAVNGECWVYGDPKISGASLDDIAANGRRVLQDEYVTEACFWDDPKTGERCVVFCSQNRAKPDGGSNFPVETSLYRPQSGEKIKLADGKRDAGLSRDGTHLGDTSHGVRILDLPNKKEHHLNWQFSACNSTMSPDNTYRIMHLYAPHTHFGIRDKYDRELWRIGGVGNNWDRPRWSNSPDLCTVDQSSIRIIRISTKEYAFIRGPHLTAPELWVPSGVKTPSRPSPIEDLKLEQLAEYKRKLAEAEDYSPIITELRAMNSPEAEAIVAELDKQAGMRLAAAKANDDALVSIGDLNYLAARYAEHPAGRQAREILKSATFQREYKAAQDYRTILNRELEIRDVKGARRSYNDPAFFERNKGTVMQVAEALAKMRTGQKNTKALARAEALAQKYDLPGSVKLEKEQLAVIATITKVSHVPTFTEIAPYKNAITYVRASVGDIVTGTYRKRDILVVHYVIKDNKLTPAAEWKPNQKQFLELERLDMHPEVENVFASDDENDLDLVPYLAVKVINW